MVIFRRLCLLMAFGTTVAMGVFLMPANSSVLWKSFSGNAPIPDPPAILCKQQSWYNADRVCVSWTAVPEIEMVSADWKRIIETFQGMPEPLNKASDGLKTSSPNLIYPEPPLSGVAELL